MNVANVTFLDLLLVSSIIVLWMFVVAIAKTTFGRRSNLAEENKRLRAKIKQLKREIKETEERLRAHYEQLLKEASIKNTIMIALYEAWKEGKLAQCYRDGGDVKILADGTVLCDMGDPEKSYVVGGKE